MIKFISIFLLTLSAITFATAQDYIPLENASKKEKKLYAEAKNAAFARQYGTALRDLQKLLDKNPQLIDAWILKGQIYFDQQRLPEAQQALKKALALNPSYNDLVYYILGITSFSQDDFEGAATWFDDYEAQSPKDQSRLERAQTYAKQSRIAAELIANPVPFEAKPMSNAINSAMPEVLPSLTADESFFIFTRRVQGQDDFYFSQRDENGNWLTAQPLTNLNTPQNEGGQTISADGRTIIFTAGDRKDTRGGFDLYISELRDGKYSVPVNLGDKVNSPERERQPSLSPDGRYLYFESARSGGLGGSDIWVSERQTNGAFGMPKNVGAPINTAADDQSPFIHADGKTLYFMSKGHPGMGGFDLFVSRKQSDGNWGEPENLGYPINNKASQGALFVALNGKTAYYTSNEAPPSYGGREDIYTFELPEKARPAGVTYVKAIVKDADTYRRIAGAEAEIVALQTEELFANSVTDNNGVFLNVLPVGEDYALSVSAEGYLFHSENFALRELRKVDQPYELEVFLQPIPTSTTLTEKAKPIVLKNIFFKTNEAILLPTSLSELQRLFRLLKAQPNLHIQINGHTDNVGSDTDNQDLSEHRAQAVYDYLIQEGIAAERLQFKGFGESEPIASNETVAGRQQNRRTEFVVLSNE